MLITSASVSQFRFALLCHAACEAPLVLPLGGFTYGEKCLFLVNDWHSSLVPLYVNNFGLMIVSNSTACNLSGFAFCKLLLH